MSTDWRLIADYPRFSVSPRLNQIICNGCGNVNYVMYPASLSAIRASHRAFKERHKDCIKGKDGYGDE